MKVKYLLLLTAIMAQNIHIKADDGLYAPWTKSTITNNTNYPIEVTVKYTLPGCKKDPLTKDYGWECQPTMGVKYTLESHKTTQVINPPSNPSHVDNSHEKPENSLLVELTNVEKTSKKIIVPVKIDNPPVKNFMVEMVNDKLQIVQKPL